MRKRGKGEDVASDNRRIRDRLSEEKFCALFLECTFHLSEVRDIDPCDANIAILEQGVEERYRSYVQAT